MKLPLLLYEANLKFAYGHQNYHQEIRRRSEGGCAMSSQSGGCIAMEPEWHPQRTPDVLEAGPARSL